MQRLWVVGPSWCRSRATRLGSPAGGPRRQPMLRFRKKVRYTTKPRTASKSVVNEFFRACSCMNGSYNCCIICGNEGRTDGGVRVVGRASSQVLDPNPRGYHVERLSTA
eukprot:338571-Prymnesium_polylepis.1